MIFALLAIDCNMIQHNKLMHFPFELFMITESTWEIQYQQVLHFIPAHLGEVQGTTAPQYTLKLRLQFSDSQRDSSAEGFANKAG